MTLYKARNKLLMQEQLSVAGNDCPKAEGVSTQSGNHYKETGIKLNCLVMTESLIDYFLIF